MPYPRVIPHSDGMGIVHAVGEGVDPSRLGERVWTWNAAWGRANGTAAQLVALPHQQAVRLPDGTPDEAGACLGIPALTALHAVLTGEGVQGKRLLVAGGAGAVGHYAVQFAKMLGAAQVVTTVSNAHKAQLARDAGADVVINYKTEDVSAAVLQATQGRGVDRVIELDIAANGALDAAAVAPNGEWVVYGSGQPRFTLDFFPMIAKNIVARFFIVYNLTPPDRLRATQELTRLLESGRVLHNVSHRLPLEEIAAAHDTVAAGEAGGNVVLSTNPARIAAPA